jgi:hypothetical protein
MAKSKLPTCTGVEHVDPRTVVTVEEMAAKHGESAAHSYSLYGAYGRRVCTSCGNIVLLNANCKLRKHVAKKWEI